MSGSANYRESVLQVGSPNPLNGVLLEVSASTNSPRPCVIILNSGLLHHVGSCGFSVKLARLVAASGHNSFRFDFSGIGDSPARAVVADYMTRMEQEVSEVIDHLQARLGCDQFVLYGLCSGAFTSLACAANDARVVGVAQIAPQAFRTPRWYVNHFLPKLINPKAYTKRIAALFNRESQPSYEDSFEQLADADIEVPDRRAHALQYEALVARNVPMFALSTRGEADFYNYVGQFQDMLPNVKFDGLLEEHYFADTRHIITEPDDQLQVLALVAAWIARLTPQVVSK